MIKRMSLVACLVIGLFVFIGSQISQATILSYNYTLEFSGAAEPEGSAPWLTATISDETAGQVTLTLNSFGLTGGEFIDSWYFNFNPVLNAASNLNFTTDQTDASVTAISGSNNAFKADGDNARYDYKVDFVQENSAGRFTRDESFSITFLSTTISAYDFDFGNVGSTKGGPFYMAAHVGGIANNSLGTSGWIASTGSLQPVPEPATMLLFGTGLVGLAGARLRKKKK